jgi:NADH:ubiquinone oxidoreductase subunit 3 (subunit A)
MINEKKKLIFDKITNGYFVIMGYILFYIIMVILYSASGNIRINVGIVMFIGGFVSLLIITWVFVAVSYDIYRKI